MARIALRRLGRRGSTVTGLFNRLGAFVRQRFLTRKRRVLIMGRAVQARLPPG